MSLAFQSNGFQTNAFQIGPVNNTDGTILLGGGPRDHYSYQLPHTMYLHEQERIAKRQQEIIAKKLEAQENLLRQRELQEIRDKQSARQLLALQNEQLRLLAGIEDAMAELQRLQLITNNNNAILVLMAAYPYLTIGGPTMH